MIIPRKTKPMWNVKVVFGVVVTLVGYLWFSGCGPMDKPYEKLQEPICHIGGCSGQICSDLKDVSSTCEWKEWYACYRDATCEAQEDGACSWTMDEKLRKCLLDKGYPLEPNPNKLCITSSDCAPGEYCTTEDEECLSNPNSCLTVCWGVCKPISINAGVKICHETPIDHYFLEVADIHEDTLQLDISYSGGCEEHDFKVCWDGSFLESNPVQVHLNLIHDGHGDPCEAVITERRIFDLGLLKKMYIDAYQTESGTIVIHIDQKTLKYYF